MNAWQHLPNAPLIDWVLESLRTDPEKWAAAWNSAWNAACNETWDVTWAAAWNSAWNAIQDAARDEARDEARDAAQGAALAAAWTAARIAALNATRYPILALIAYDDCDEYLNMRHEQLLAWAHLSEKPQAVLLLPLKWVQEHECLATLT